MKNRNFKKTLSVFLSVLMILSCWVWIAPTDAEAANKYYVKVYVNIYDGSDGYGGAYNVNSTTGKPNNYSWATNDGWYGRINMTGFTVFGEGGDFSAQDVSSELLEAEKLNTYYDMSSLSNDNANGDWDSKAIAQFTRTFELDSFPVEIFWMNDENNWDGGNTGFAIRKLTVATSEGGVEHTMWEGLAGSDSETYNYYGSITPTGIHTCFEDYVKNYNMDDYKFYKAITLSSQRAWSDPYSAGSYGTYYLNEYANGGVSATFSEGVESVAYNVDYINTGSTDTYYMNFINHSKTQAATITVMNNSDKFVESPVGKTIPAGGKLSLKMKNISSLGGDGTDAANFCFKYTLENVYESDAIDAKLAEFYQPCYIGVWNSSDDSKQISDENGDGNTGFSLYKADNYTWGDNSMTIINTFQTTEGILERNSATSGDGTDNATFNYNYYIDTTGITNWTQTGLRFHVKESQYYTLSFQPADYPNECGTITLGGDYANKDIASITIADLVYTSPTEAFTYSHNQKNSTYTYADYYTTGTPMWTVTQSDSLASFYNNSEGWFRFAGNMIKGSSNSAATINFSNMTYRERQNGQKVYFSGTINVYAFDKTALRDYVRETLIDFAPMSLRYDSTAFATTYQEKLSNAMKVLAKQKTTQNEIDTALAELKSAVDALLTTDNLINQIDELTHTQFVDDIGSAVANKIDTRYVLIPLGEHTVPENTAFIGNGAYKDETNKRSGVTTNYTKDDTTIDVLNMYYWNIDYSEIDGKIDELEEAINNFDSDEYNNSFKVYLENAKADLEAIKTTIDVVNTPTAQEDIDNLIDAADNLLKHIGDSYDNCIYDGSDEDTDADIVNENYNCIDGGTVEYVCIICGKAQVVETKDPQEGGHTLTYVNNNDGTHTATCTECGFSETVAHVFTNPVLVRPTLVDGTWTDGTYTYTCICGAEKVEPAVRADYSELEDAVDALEELKDNENLTDEAKEAINAAIKKADDLADDLVTAEQKQIDDLVKELQKVKADAEEAIRNKEIGVEKITEADSGVKVQFIDESGLGAIDSIQLGKDNGFIIRAANGNADSDITITKLNGDAVNKTLASGESTDFNISADGLTAGIATYTITYTIDGLKDADGNLVEFTTEAYLYVKEEAYNPYHLMDEAPGGFWQTATSKWNYYIEATNYGDFELVHYNKAPKADFGNDNLGTETNWFGNAQEIYDYEDSNCQAGCTDGNYKTGDSHAATYRYYIDTSLASTWEAAGFRARIVETPQSVYENAPLKYTRLATNKAYLDGIAGDDKTFTVTFVPSSSGTQGKTWVVTSTGTMDVSSYKNPDRSEVLFGEHKNKDGFDETTAYANFSGAIPVSTTEAKFMFSPRIEFNGTTSSESVTMTTHLYITSYDKAALREAVANAEQAGYNSEYFNPEKYEAYENALKNAKEVLGKAETNQDEIDAATEALNAAIADLEKAENEAKFVLTVTHSIHESADKNSEATGTEYDYYLVNGEITPALKTSIIALDTINKYDAAATLNVTADAEHTYNYWYIDYSGVQGAIDAADAIINDTTTGYSDEYKQDVKDAKDALQNVLDGKDVTTTPESQSTVNDAIDAVTALTGHTHNKDVVIPAVDPTCTDDGLTVGAKCSVCGKITIAQETDPKTGHNYDKNDDGEITRADAVYTAPVETDGIWSDAVYTYTCQNNCGASYTETVARADYEEYDKAVEDLNDLLDDITLTEDAKNKINEALEENDIADNLDSDSQQTVTDAADALKDVIDEITGENKDKYTKVDFTDYNAALEIYNNTTVGFANDTEKETVQAAIDSVAGIVAESAKVPDNQNKIDAATAVIEAINDKYAECANGNHNYESVTTQPTCTVQGYTTHTCKVCGDGYTDAFTGPNGHDWSEWELTLAPTKDTDGTYTRTCSKGDATETKSVAREDYTDYDAAVERAEGMLNDDKLTDAAKDEIIEALEKAEELDQNLPADVIEDGETVIDNDSAEKIAEATEDLTEVLDKIANDKTGAYEKVDYTNYNNAVDAYEALKDTMTAEDKAAVEAIKAEIAKIPADGTKKDYQAQVDKAAEDIAAINAKYGDCANGNHTDVTTDNDHNCDICGKADVTEHDYVNPVLTQRPTQNDDGTWNNGYYTSTCNCGDTSTTVAERANYSEFDEALEALEAYLENENITDAYNAKIKTVVDGIKDGTFKIDTDGDGENDLRYDYVAAEQDKVDDLTDVINGFVAEVNSLIADDSIIKPNFTDLIAEWEEYLELVEQYGGEVNYGTEDDSLTATVVSDGYIKDATNKMVVDGFEDLLFIMNDPSANKKENQDFINGVKDQLEAINEGIKDGTLRDPNFEAYDAEVKIYNEGTSKVNISADESQAVADARAIVDAIKANPDATAKDSDATIAEQTAIIKAINDKYAVCVTGTHDYADATCTEAKTCKLCGATTGIANGHDWSEWELTLAPTKDTEGTYTRTCSKGDATETKSVVRENYTDYDAAVERAEDMLDNNKLTDAAKDEITEALEKAEELDQNLPADVIEDGETVIDNDSAEKIAEATEDLTEVLDKIANDKTGAYEKVDYTNYNNAVNAYEALKDTMTAEDKAAVEAIKAEIAEIPVDGTKKDYQAQVDKAAEDIAAINAKYGDCANGNHTDVTTDNDHNCDICGKADVTEHDYVNPVLTQRPTQNADGTWNNGYYTSTCNCGATSTTEAERANYTAYDEAVADLNKLLADETLTDAAKSEINAVLSGNKIADNYIATADEQAIVDAAAAALKVVLDKIKNDTTGAHLKPDYEAWEEAETAYDALDKTNVKDEIIDEAEALKAEIAEKQADDTLTQATATQDDIDAATKRLNEIIDGINDGSLKDPDYSKVEEKLEDVNEAEGLNKDTQDKIDAIEKELQDIKDKTEPEANYRDDQDEVDALEDLLDEILEDIADGTAKAPDYTNWDSAEGTYDALDKTNVKAEILDEVTDLKNTINNLKADPTANAKEDQKTIDDATKRLLEIIDGITDGSLLNPDAECVHDYATVEVEPTCHSVGYTLYVCKKCKDSYKVNGAPAIDHNWKWSESKTGSCLEAKTRTGYCLNDGCNATKTEYVRDADGNIVYGNHVYVVIEGKPATCTTPGHTDYTRCVNCGEITESVTIPAPGHIDSDNNGNCDVCNYLTKPAVGKCDCLCHNDSFFGKLIYKIANFFWKLFKINQGCQCGVQHW